MGVAPGFGLEDGVAILKILRTQRNKERFNTMTGRLDRYRDIYATLRIGYQKQRQRKSMLVMSRLNQDLVSTPQAEDFNQISADRDLCWPWDSGDRASITRMRSTGYMDQYPAGAWAVR